MEKGQLLYEGKAKRLYTTNEAGVLLVSYKDSATAFNGEKKETITGKGELNNAITSTLFQELHRVGISTHFIRKISSTEQLVREVSIIPLEVVVRKTVAGSLAKRLGLEEGMILNEPIVEFYYKDDSLGDPLVTTEHIRLLQLATPEELDVLKTDALTIFQHMHDYFHSHHVRLVDFKLEFGRTSTGDILLADEISPDTCRLWDETTNEKLDKDVFRRGLGNLTDAYQTIADRIGGTIA
ncbi:phosphoribosylaminoimidazolesuccinocarboxamide synthase [Paenisporosarcina cavernae]|uniref:Phosphoribosylaminoimidazole-succinocarboxamide synthase n=1 Tax=Paenisporosarcina cavernae TaxID=2320858 RepID=A0A385YUS8_9BACL|nr:phosphoribosylaminoimidazolesuccinocarboxamide synthase [Paenisporosarcina cavernae]AYC30314.1 phosphoribosylaminoimidazolesuccinocarboxamide synthase [Paenisporosarcina cavernae]